MSIEIQRDWAQLHLRLATGQCNNCQRVGYRHYAQWPGNLLWIMSLVGVYFSYGVASRFNY